MWLWRVRKEQNSDMQKWRVCIGSIYIYKILYSRLFETSSLSLSLSLYVCDYFWLYTEKEYIFPFFGCSTNSRRRRRRRRSQVVYNTVWEKDIECPICRCVRDYITLVACPTRCPSGLLLPGCTHTHTQRWLQFSFHSLFLCLSRPPSSNLKAFFMPPANPIFTTLSSLRFTFLCV